MRSIKIFTVIACFAVAGVLTMGFINTPHVKTLKGDNPGKGFAVIELFTSEGCSSCPPADELVAKVEKESNGEPIYILAYHVDYWNRLGWKDAFSNADYSHRQNDYANYLNLSSVYTPQIVVNGKTEFVGSAEGTLRNAIKTSLQKTPLAEITLNVAAIGQSHADLKYHTEGTDENTALLIAVLQKNAQTKVGGGENGGRTLSHVQIVRKLQQFSLNGNSGAASVALPQGFDAKKWEIIGFLQNTSNGTITGATRVTLPAEVNASDK
jgi:hypothetical protein